MSRWTSAATRGARSFAALIALSVGSACSASVVESASGSLDEWTVSVDGQGIVAADPQGSVLGVHPFDLEADGIPDLGVLSFRPAGWNEEAVIVFDSAGEVLDHNLDSLPPALMADASQSLGGLAMPSGEMAAAAAWEPGSPSCALQVQTWSMTAATCGTAFAYGFSQWGKGPSWWKLVGVAAGLGFCGVSVFDARNNWQACAGAPRLDVTVVRPRSGFVGDRFAVTVSVTDRDGRPASFPRDEDVRIDAVSDSCADGSSLIQAVRVRLPPGQPTVTTEMQLLHPCWFQLQASSPSATPGASPLVEVKRP